jgi:hypothetical protein
MKTSMKTTTVEQDFDEWYKANVDTPSCTVKTAFMVGYICALKSVVEGMVGMAEAADKQAAG